MVPLSFFLFAWLLLVSAFAVLVLFTVFMMLRYGMSGCLTYVATAGFLLVVTAVLISSGSYLATVDWSASIPLFAATVPGF